MWFVAAAGGLASLAACQTIADPPEPRPAPMLFAQEPDIRVRVAGSAATTRLDGPARLLGRPAPGERPDVSPVLMDAPVTISSSAAGIYVRDARGEHTFPPGVNIEIVAADAKADVPAAESIVTVAGVRYPGTATIRPGWTAGPGAFDVIITMPVESYLPGVLTHELLKDWPRQTYEAQAVAARTYALHERGRARGERRPFDVEDTTNDQVYGGATAASVPNEAARATRGMVLLSRGALLRAYFSSTCGGRPSSASKVWPTKPGYEFNLAEPLQGKPRPAACQNSKWYRWEATRSVDDVSRRLAHWGATFKHPVAAIGHLRGAQVAMRNAAERPVEFVVTDERGAEFRMTAEELRNALNQPTRGVAAFAKENTVRSGDLEMEFAGDTVRIRGRGWGHGVGLCQYCAKGLAEAGHDWQSMMRDFYPGAEVVRAYP